MTLVEDRPRLTPQADAESWLAAFEAALRSRDAAAAADLFLADGLWRDLLAFTWTIETMAGRAAIEATLRATLARTQPANFRIPPRRTPPRRAMQHPQILWQAARTVRRRSLAILGRT
jgi:hypothetical protein